MRGNAWIFHPRPSYVTFVRGLPCVTVVVAGRRHICSDESHVHFNDAVDERILFCIDTHVKNATWPALRLMEHHRPIAHGHDAESMATAQASKTPMAPWLNSHHSQHNNSPGSTCELSESLSCWSCCVSIQGITHPHSSKVRVQPNGTRATVRVHARVEYAMNKFKATVQTRTPWPGFRPMLNTPQPPGQCSAQRFNTTAPRPGRQRQAHGPTANTPKPWTELL